MTGSWSTGVACKQPVIVWRQLFISTSTSHICALRHHEAAQYSAGAYTNARTVVHSTLVLASQVVPAMHLRSAECDDTFPLSPSRCFLKVREWSSLTPR